MVTKEWTWNKIVNREKGAVTVLAIDPAKPPQNNCFMASLERDGGDSMVTGAGNMVAGSADAVTSSSSMGAVVIGVMIVFVVVLV